MIEIMVADFRWLGEEWCIKSLQKIDNAIITLKFCDGSVNNILFECENSDGYEDVLAELFNSYSWLNKVLIKQGEELVGIYERK